MTLKQQLLEDMKQSMKDKATIRKNTVQLIRSGVLQVEKDNRIELDDEGVLDVITKELKKRRDVMPDYQKSGRQDLIDQLEAEIEVLLSYLPKQLTDQEIDDILNEVIAKNGATSAKDMGKVMKELTPILKGRADTKKVSEIVKQRLT